MLESGNLPSEFMDFFKHAGSVLLIKGKSGTGKTISAMQLINDLVDPSQALYISTRTSEIRLMHHFSWMTPEWISRMVSFSKSSRHGELKSMTTRFFETKYEHPVTSELEEIKRKAQPKSLVVIDSIEGLAENLDMTKERALEDFIDLIVDPGNANLIVTSETTGETTLDHLVDGIVTIYREMVDGRILRYIVFDKLRGAWIRQAQYIFTLKGGRTTFADIFPVWSLRQVLPKEHAKWAPMTALPETVSSGSPDLDSMLNGGFTPGTYSLFILGENVPNEVVHLIQFPFLIDSFSKGNGVFVVPTSGITAEQIARIISPYIENARLNEFGRFITEERLAKPRTEEAPYLTVISSEPNLDRDFTLALKSISELRERTKRPVARIIGLDYLDARYANKQDDLFRTNENLVALTHSYGDIQLSFAREGAKSIPRLIPITDAVFKIETVNGTIIMYGAKPRTPVFAVTPDFEKGIARINLMPIA